jgi:hypothetical protein
LKTSVFLQFIELAGGCFALWAALGGFGTFVDVTTNGADKFFGHRFEVYKR